LDVYSGNDDQTVPILALNGVGVISVLSNIMPKQMHDMCQLFFDGKVKESADLQLNLINLMDSMFCDVNPIPVKEAMNIIGLDVGECRLPLVSMDENKKADLKAVLQKYNLI
ncbi:MAG: dihydrodipicolinate synthase family protein, partial [Oscillospiraceae bacterium]